VLAQSGCYSLCLPSSAGNNVAIPSVPGTSDDPGVPASISIIGSTPSGFLPYVSVYSYQINNKSGVPVTGSDYYAAESISGAAINSNGHYVQAPNGVITDYVGLAVVTVPHELYGAATTQTQTFSALYGGYFYSLPTVLQHNISISSGGNVSISVTINSP
jgi:hypothetical protein